MDRKKDILKLLQLNGGTFPTGGFSQSWGLETYVTEGRVSDVESFKEFMNTYLRSSIALCEGPMICRAYELSRTACRCGLSEEVSEELRELEELSNAMKVTSESREGSLRMGKAFARIAASLVEEEMDMIRKIFAGDIPAGKNSVPEVSYPVIYGCVCGMMDIDLEDAIMSYIFGAANTLTQSALKLIPLGNVDAQQALFDAQDIMEECCRLAMDTALDDVTNFCPGIDMASLKHEVLPVRLYMS